MRFDKLLISALLVCAVAPACIIDVPAPDEAEFPCLADTDCIGDYGCQPVSEVCTVSEEASFSAARFLDIRDQDLMTVPTSQRIRTEVFPGQGFDLLYVAGKNRDDAGFIVGPLSGSGGPLMNCIGVEGTFASIAQLDFPGFLLRSSATDLLFLTGRDCATAPSLSGATAITETAGAAGFAAVSRGTSIEIVEGDGTTLQVTDTLDLGADPESLFALTLASGQRVVGATVLPSEVRVLVRRLSGTWDTVPKTLPGIVADAGLVAAAPNTSGQFWLLRATQPLGGDLRVSNFDVLQDDTVTEPIDERVTDGLMNQTIAALDIAVYAGKPVVAFVFGEAMRLYVRADEDDWQEITTLVPSGVRNSTVSVSLASSDNDLCVTTVGTSGDVGYSCLGDALFPQ